MAPLLLRTTSFTLMMVPQMTGKLLLMAF